MFPSLSHTHIADSVAMDSPRQTPQKCAFQQLHPSPSTPSPPNLDGPAICNANQGDSHELIRASRLKPAIRSFQPSEARIAKKGVQFGNPEIRKSMVSIKFPPVILGPEMAAPILWAPGIFWFFLLENPHAHKIPPFRGGFWVF